MMIGAAKDTFNYLEPLFKALCLENGYLHAGENGAGHYVKMVHNGIEYGMMQAIAEGFELLDSSPYDLDYHALAKLWNNGSVIRSWLIELTANLFSADPKLEQIKGVAGSSGTGLWTVEEALARKCLFRLSPRPSLPVTAPNRKKVFPPKWLPAAPGVWRS
jgi:6-phosphogluconate dehydrogenase